MKLLELVEEIKRRKDIVSVVNAIELFELKYSEQNININDKNCEGVFFVGNNREAVDRNNKIVGKNTQSITETTYSRAIFNKKKIIINNDEVDIISYECPLLRAKSGAVGNQFKLDLLGFRKRTNTIIVIECKYTIGNNTNPQYGLIEAFFYSLAIHKHITVEKEGVVKQIEKCYRENNGHEITIGQNINVEFYVVAPRIYWERYINNKASRKNIARTEELLVSAIEEKCLPFRFSGYLSLGCCGEDFRIETKDGVHFPFLVSEAQATLGEKFESMHPPYASEHVGDCPRRTFPEPA